MDVHKISDIVSGEVDLSSSVVGGNGTFQKIRELASDHLKSAGDAILLRDLVHAVKAKFEFETRKAHNYTRNAVKKSFRLEKVDGVVFVVKS